MIKKCVFCGSDDIKYDADSYNGLIDSRLCVECKECGSLVYTYGKTIREAIERYDQAIIRRN